MRDDSTAEREILLYEHLEKIEMRWVVARGEGIERPAVLLLDASDAHARAILETSHETERIESHIADGRRRGLVPTISCGLSLEEAWDIISDEFGLPEAAVFDEPEDGYVVVVVAEGGFSVFVLSPVPA